MPETIRIYNKTLEPNLWDENQNLRPEVRVTLLKIAKDFYDSTDFKSEIIDILMLGSSVNYNWTPESDVDVHVVIDIRKEGLDPEHFRKMLDCLGGRWNKDHEIYIKGHKVEVYIQDISEKNSTIEKARPHSSMFSLLNNKWLIPPKFEKISLDKEAIKKAFHDIKDQIDDIIENRNVDGLKKLMKAIREYRNKGLEGPEGEFSTENIVFKALRHTGQLERLRDAINDIYDNMVSLEEMESYLNKLSSIDTDVINEIVNETIEEVEMKDSPYILIGAVDGKLNVAAIKQMGTKYDPSQRHGLLYRGEYELDPSTGIDWRYRSDTNELLYWDWPSDRQRDVVNGYLKERYRIEQPRVIVSHQVGISPGRAMGFHGLGYKYENGPKMEEELLPVVSICEGEFQYKNFIVTGMVSHDLDVAGEMYHGGKGKGSITHGMLKQWHGHWADSIDWRYRADENSVYYIDREPNDDQKKAIFEFLKNRFGVTNRPSFILLTVTNKQKAHNPQYFSGDEAVENMEIFGT